MNNKCKIYSKGVAFVSFSVGLDIGSTTIKYVLLENSKIIDENYERHFSRVREKTSGVLKKIAEKTNGENIKLYISGSAGLGISEELNLPFIQEVAATGETIKKLAPDTSAVIELGGEDAKIIFFEGGTDERMNGSCAGGTGAFIDQMATLLDVTADQLDEMSLKYEKVYPIASRCGVFAKTDIQPLLNQGAKKEDIARSIYQAVVNQTIAGLAQGRKIKGKVLFLGGPLSFCKGLRQCFQETLNLSDENAVFPDYARISVALGAAFFAENSEKTYNPLEISEKISKAKNSCDFNTLPPLFESEADFNQFLNRHKNASVPKGDITTYKGRAYLGIDCGSTTTKLCLISENCEILYTYYSSNKGNPVEIIREQLGEIYNLCSENIEISGSAVTGYGEELIKNAFSIDYGVVETIAHYRAAKYFRPDVDFILDIGGQDIKCFKIKNNAIDSIMLNEACSSGCGSFLETFAKSMGYSISDFAKKGLGGDNPVNLGSRCTVFMNSSVKQAQKEGATVENISAGLSISVVKNAIYKVIRASSVEELGRNIVVQGGTFYNDAVLRAFEMELGKNVIRPEIAGLMGAFGAALYSMKKKKSSIISPEELKNFTHTSRATTCKGCENRCYLTVNTFGDGKVYISGNKCEKGAKNYGDENPLPNLYEYKREYLKSLPNTTGNLGKIGLPLALGMYELLPLWHGIFEKLGFDVIISDMSRRSTYEKGQFSIPSDTACYPAKIMHGHIEELIEKGADYIFYPALTYNVDEKSGKNHYNCPVVAYYSELLSGNMENLSSVRFLSPYLNINNQRELSRELLKYLNTNTDYKFKASHIKNAVSYGFLQYENYMKMIRQHGEDALKFARDNKKRIMILAGRPYHIDSEIIHGIDKLANSLGFVVVSEDSICHLADTPKVEILNQWTYHARLYKAANYATKHSDTELVQLVSFGCGVDAITTDEVRTILEENGKFYTQLKIDEITNLGAVKIRLRSLLAVLEEGE